MEESHSADKNTDDILIESNENSADSSQKGVKKRIAQSPSENDAKKPKLTREASVIEISSESPVKDGQQSPKTPITPRTPKVSKEDREKLKREKLEEKEKQRAERERLLEEKRLEKEKLAEEKRLERERKEKYP
uniref:Chromatin assembly factor 1 subunit A n=1 Tax=Caenorhabditis tropicalis TaxID=1561998 RepID=A0A1I7T4F6_9PELO